jgi:hypothetical protein
MVKVKQLFDSLSNVKIKNFLKAGNLPKSAFDFDSLGNIKGLKNSLGSSSTLLQKLKTARIKAAAATVATGAGLSSAAKIVAKNKKLVALGAGATIFAIPGALEEVLGKKDCSSLTGDELEECEIENEKIDAMAASLRNPIAAAAKVARDSQMYIFIAIAVVLLLIIMSIIF